MYPYSVEQELRLRQREAYSQARQARLVRALRTERRARRAARSARVAAERVNLAPAALAR
jgi:alpha-D-ribose 1-methylphosphonate 5-triphosphate synthase subunit PhnG